MPTRPNLRIGHVAIFVRDLDKMRAFYTDILGLRLPTKARTRSLRFR
jgi:catechol 2,3-dioxygenase-like lactoylglutathione lyase family enzyme